MPDREFMILDIQGGSRASVMIPEVELQCLAGYLIERYFKPALYQLIYEARQQHVENKNK